MPTREEMQSVAEEIVRSYEDRISGIAQLRQTVKTDLKEFQDSRIAMSKELRADLAKSVADRKAAVSTQLKELDAAHGTMSRELKAELAKVCPALAEQDRKRQSDAREFRGKLARAVAEGKAATQDRLKELASIEAGARVEWQKLTATMQAKRGVLVAEVKPPEAVAPPPVKKVPEKEAIARAEVAEVTPKMTALRDQVFAYLADHPDGTRMTVLEREFKEARIQMARVLRNLVDENRVEKRDILYFAV